MTQAPENEYFIRAHSHARTGNGRQAPFRFGTMPVHLLCCYKGKSLGCIGTGAINGGYK
jgi:hypothetical protein